MDAATVNRLSDRGRRAADALIERFQKRDGWENHGWLRFRSCTQLTAHWLRELEAAAESQSWSAIQSWIDGQSPSYLVLADSRHRFRQAVRLEFEAARQIEDGMLEALDTNAPRPQPGLRIQPGV